MFKLLGQPRWGVIKLVMNSLRILLKVGGRVWFVGKGDPILQTRWEMKRRRADQSYKSSALPPYVGNAQ